MVVYSDDTYTFINKVDRIANLTTLFRINSFEVKHVSVPSLSANSVIMWNTGKLQTAGNPYPGGTIYLQNDYVAIDYDKNTIGFKLIYSAGYQYNENYLQVIPTNNQSTDIARMLNTNPSNLIFVRNGCITVIDDADINGVNADYIALDSGEVIAAFDVKSRCYAAVPFKVGMTDIEVVSLANSFCKYGDDFAYHLVGSCEGLKQSPSLKSYIKSVRQDMKSYKRLSIDLNRASGFAKPISDSLYTDGLIYSALNMEVARQYISDKEKLDQPLTDIFRGVIINADGLGSLIASGLGDNLENADLLNLIKEGKLPDSTLALLNTEFNQILTLYNDTYIKYKKVASMAALKRAMSDATIMNTKASEVSPGYFTSALRHVLTGDFYKDAIISQDLKFNFHDLIQYDTSGYSWDPLNKDEDAGLYTGTLSKYIKEYGQDCSLTDEDLQKLSESRIPKLEDGSIDDSAVTQSFNIPLIDSSNILPYDEVPEGVQSPMLLRLAGSIYNQASAIGEKFPFALSDCVLSTGQAVYTCQKSCRWGVYKSSDLNISLFDNQSITVKATKISICNTEAIIYFRGSTHGDWFINKDWGKAKSQIDASLRSALGGSYTPHFNFFADRTIRMAGHPRKTYAKARDWDGNPVNFIIDGYYIVPIIGISSKFSDADTVATIRDRLEACWPKFKDSYQVVLNGLVNSARVAKKVNSVIDVFASNCAYDLCGYLFEACKENYEAQAIGCIGANYDGIPVALNELGYITNISVDYVNGIIKLINSSPMSDELRNKLSPFVNQLNNTVLTLATAKPIYYVSRANLQTAVAVSSLNAFYHYLYGAI